ncbi:MAG: maltotransferase domain-containing protein, partial [Acidimicrobiales bacterium]
MEEDARRHAPSDLQGRARPVVEHVSPQVDGGRYPVKREAGDVVVVEADVFCDGHDELSCDVLWRVEAESRWRAAPMGRLSEDRWRGSFPLDSLGRYRFCVRATVDAYGTWLRDVGIKAEAGQDLTVELLVGADLLNEAASRAGGAERARLQALAGELREASDTASYAAPGSMEARSSSVDLGAGERAWRAPLDPASSAEAKELVRRHPDPGPGVTSEELQLVVDRPEARFSAWYELFPRSCSPVEGRHGTFDDVRARLDYVERLGFDVLYL